MPENTKSSHAGYYVNWTRRDLEDPNPLDIGKAVCVSYPPRGTTCFLASAEAPAASPRDELFEDFEDFCEALALGVADDSRKVGAFRGIGLALSGGRDSRLTLLVAWRNVPLRSARAFA